MLRRYYKYFGTEGLLIKAGNVEFLKFGLQLPEKAKTETTYELGTIVDFLLKAKRKVDYQDYLNDCVDKGQDFVRPKDAEAFKSGLFEASKIQDQESNVGREDVGKIIDKLAKGHKGRRDLATADFNKLQSFLKHANFDLRKFKGLLKSFGKADKGQLEKALMKKFEAIYVERPNLLEEDLKPLQDRECLGALRPETSTAEFGALLNVFGDEFNDVKACLDGKKTLADLGGDVGASIVKETLGKILTSKFEGDLTEESSIGLYVSCNDRAMSYLALIDDKNLLKAKSRFFPEHQWTLPREEKLGHAVIWSVLDNANVIRRRKFDIFIANEKSASLFDGWRKEFTGPLIKFDYNFRIVSKPVASDVLCNSRFSKSKPFQSPLELLAKSVNVVSSELIK